MHFFGIGKDEDDRFARAADPVDDQVDGCANCSIPSGDGVRVRMLKDFAFHVVGTDEEARVLDREHGLAQVSIAEARATGNGAVSSRPVTNSRARLPLSGMPSSIARVRSSRAPSQSRVRPFSVARATSCSTMLP